MANIYSQLQLTSMAHHKKKILMLVLLILSKEYVKNNNVDVCLAPLVEELQELWRGVNAMGYLSSQWDKKIYSTCYIDLGNTQFTCIWLTLKASNKRVQRLPNMWA
jgi:hypothetical protein